MILKRGPDSLELVLYFPFPGKDANLAKYPKATQGPSSVRLHPDEAAISDLLQMHLKNLQNGWHLSVIFPLNSFLSRTVVSRSKQLTRRFFT